ncbi:PepSY domain-containing protein [Geodermatophilus sp. YIM 151500]|uniref:PepSY domain-containing protein n=1 Tax=Geodermatophilus sp. YIM 151500 TaxID=2984531 RepID=UPI0021E47E82|nr:PepSY domain-containing protein [Geodermatophilus sp. YIM 151500]MCV2492016.1 PepSY domain-containing protein [Geodermatophilus sp. YIM 151500]
MLRSANRRRVIGIALAVSAGVGVGLGAPNLWDGAQADRLQLPRVQAAPVNPAGPADPSAQTDPSAQSDPSAPSDPSAQSDPAGPGTETSPPAPLTLDQAKTVAADYAPGQVVEVDQDTEPTGLQYDVTLLHEDGTVTKVEVDATTGQVVSSKRDNDFWDWD